MVDCLQKSDFGGNRELPPLFHIHGNHWLSAVGIAKRMHLIGVAD